MTCRPVLGGGRGRLPLDPEATLALSPLGLRSAASASRVWLAAPPDYAQPAVRPQPKKGDRMPFLFKLETVEDDPANPPTLASAVLNWRPGGTIPLGRKTLRVVHVRDDDADQPLCWSLRTCPDEPLARWADVP
jgi:hypothetical protein